MDDNVPTWAELRTLMDQLADKLEDSRLNHDWTMQELSSRGNGRLVGGPWLVGGSGMGDRVDQSHIDPLRKCSGVSSPEQRATGMML